MTSEQLADWVAICEVKARYCRLLDTKQWDAWAELFTQDFVLDTSEAGGPSPIAGRNEALAMARQAIETARTSHQVHTPKIKIVGDQAEATWAMQDRIVFDNGQGIIGDGHYIETYVKHGGEWKIGSSKLTRLHVDLTPAPRS